MLEKKVNLLESISWAIIYLDNQCWYKLVQLVLCAYLTHHVVLQREFQVTCAPDSLAAGSPRQTTVSVSFLLPE